MRIRRTCSPQTRHGRVERSVSARIEPLESRLLMAVLFVLNNNDSGAGSLRQTIASAASGDTIKFNVSGDIMLASPLTLNKSLTITGTPGGPAVTLNGNGVTSLAAMSQLVTVKLMYLTLANGQSALDGGGIASGGNLTLDHVTFQNNRAARRGGAISIANSGTITATDCMFLDNYAGGGAADASGGAVYANAGTLKFTRCTFARNSAVAADTTGPTAFSGRGGAIASPGNIALTLTNCTFDHNQAVGGAAPNALTGGAGIGGAIYLPADASAVSFLNCTIAGNSAVGGAGATASGAGEGGGADFGGAVGATVTNTIIAANSASSAGSDVIRSNRVTSKGGNVIGVGELFAGVSSFADAFDVVGSAPSPIDPYLAPLGNYGGATLTRRLLMPSLAIGLHSATMSYPATDQRGLLSTGDAGATNFDGAPIAGSGNALYFTPTGSHVAFLPQLAALESNAFTFEMRVKFTQLDPVNTLFAYGQDTAHESMRLDYDSASGALRFVMHDSAGGTIVDLTAPVSASSLLGTWHALAVTFDGSSASLYVDGSSVGTSSTSGAHPIVYPDFAFVFLGNRFGEQSFFTGVMDDVRVLNVAAEPGQVVASANIAGYWRFDERLDADTVLHDSTANHLDGFTASTTDLVRVVSDAPVLLGDVEDAYAQFQLPALDPLGGAMTFQILTAPGKGTVTLLDAASGLIRYTPAGDHNGPDTFVYRVYNAVGWADATVQVNIQPVEDAPTFTSLSDLPSATSESAYTTTISALDVDGDPLSFAALSLPAWLTLVDNGDGTASLSGMPFNGNAGVNSITLRLSDGLMTVDQTFTLAVAAINHAPAFQTTPPTGDVNAFGEFRYDFAVSDVDGDAIACAMSSLPAWLSFQDNHDGTGTLFGTPDNGDVASYHLTLTASDGQADVAQSIDFAVLYTNRAPRFVSTPPTAATSESPFRYDIVATDVDGDALHIVATTMPAWMSFLDNGDGTATLWGTPTNANAGLNDVVLSLSDGVAPAAEKHFTVTVAAINHAPTFTSTPPGGNITAGNIYTYHVTATDADGNPLVISASTLPAWLTLIDNGNGAATLSGVPTNANAGANAIVLMLSDGQTSASQSFSIQVLAKNTAPTFTSTPVKSVVAGTTYSYTITTVDVDGDPLVITAPTLPAWLTLVDNHNGTATLTGKPTDANAGLGSVVLRVSDGKATADQAFGITVTVSTPPSPIQLVNGVLTVTGGVGDDTMQVTIVNKKLRASINGLVQNFTITAVKKIVVQGSSGNDAISVDTGTIPACIVGGAGNDTLRGGDEADNISGGAGSDQIFGGGGNDRLDGGAGNDALRGDDGNDIMLGCDGDDQLFGGDGDDFLDGGKGADMLHGDDGNDILYSRDGGGRDTVFGGRGNNSARVDANDRLKDIFKLLA